VIPREQSDFHPRANQMIQFADYLRRGVGNDIPIFEPEIEKIPDNIEMDGFPPQPPEKCGKAIRSNGCIAGHAEMNIGEKDHPIGQIIGGICHRKQYNRLPVCFSR
jgi:hypothetical protein